MMKKLVLAASMLLTAIIGHSQEVGELVHVYLVGNNFLKGTLMEESNGTILHLELAQDSVIQLPMKFVDHINKGRSNRFYNRSGQSARNTGIGIEAGFANYSGAFLGLFSRTVRNSIGLHLSGHYYLKPYLSVGLGGSVEYYDDLVLPVYVQGRIFHPTKVYAPFASLQLGYAMASGDILGYDSLNEFETMRGGLVVNPSVGIRIPMFGGTDMMFDVGYRIQRVSYEADYPDDWWIQDENTRITYRSISVRVGLLF
jgi:hypothetical protein